MNTLLMNSRRAFSAAMFLTALLAAPTGAIRAEDPTADAAKPPQYRTEAVRRGDMDKVVRATGTLEPDAVIEVGAQVKGTIKRFGDDPAQANHQISWNSKVEPGTVLAYLDDTPYKAAVDFASASLRKAQAGVRAAQPALKKSTAEYQRAKELLAAHTTGQAEFEAAELVHETAEANAAVADAQLKLCEAELKQAQSNLEYTRITSPVKGIVIDRRANVGQRVDASLNAPSLFFIVENLTKLQLWMSVNEADTAEIQKGQTVLFSVAARGEKLYEGQVDQLRLNAALNQSVVTYTVVVSVDNAKGELLPYQTAAAAIKVGRRTGVLLAPNAALHWSPRTAGAKKTATAGRAADFLRPPRVWVLQEGKSPRAVEVKVGATDGTMTEITGGELKEGMQLIVGELGE